MCQKEKEEGKKKDKEKTLRLVRRDITITTTFAKKVMGGEDRTFSNAVNG